MRDLKALSVVAFVCLTSCGPVNNTQSVAQPEKQITTSEDELAIRYTVRSGTRASPSGFSVSAIRELNLPQGRWADVSDLLYELTPRYAEHCPNFDVDGNGNVEYIPTEERDINGDPKYKGDMAIIVRGALQAIGRNPWPNDLLTLAGEGARRGTIQDYHKYLDCLSGRLAGRPNRFDLTYDGNFTASDLSQLLAMGFLGGAFVSAQSTATDIARLERRVADTRVCLAYFRLGREDNVRVYQVDCNTAPHTTIRQLPDLTVTPVREVMGDALTGDVQHFCDFKSEGALVKRISVTDSALCGRQR